MHSTTDSPKNFEFIKNSYMLSKNQPEKKFKMPSHQNLEDISQPFEGILLDAYGVFWGGNRIGLLPGCKKTIENLIAQGKIVGILSNSTQLVKNEIEKFKTHGLVEGQHFHFLITSGEVAKSIFLKNELPFPTLNKKFYLCGPPHPKFSSHQTIFQDTLYEETTNLEEADFIYISIPHIDGKDQVDPSVFKEYVESFRSVKIPMVCANPDFFAHEGEPPQLVARQGSIAAMHIEQGGTVFYIGKPSERMYVCAMEDFKKFGISSPKKVLMVGDTPEIDIRGAKNFNMPSALVLKTGIMAERVAKNGLKDTLNSFSPQDCPDFFILQVGKNEL